MKSEINKELSLKRAILISLAFHVIIVLIAVYTPSDYLRPQPPINLTWVELPKGSGEDIYGLKNVNKLPDTTVQQQQEDAAKPQAKEEAPKVAPKPVPAETSTKGMPELKGKTKEKEKVTQRGPVKKSQMNSALAKIDKMLKDRQADPEAAQTGSTGEGYKYGTSDKPVRIPIDDPEYLKYQAMIRAKILRQWMLPGAITQLAATNRPIVRVIVRISKSGDVISTQWAQKSAVESLNASALGAVKRASPFPIPPERLKWEVYNEGFLVEFNARSR